NATCARAVGGLQGMTPRLVALDETEADLPMALSLQGRHPDVGRAGWGLCREFPHLVCLDFLAHLGTPRTWVAGRHRLDATRALSLVLDRLRPALAPAKALTLVLPAYLTGDQVELLLPLVQRAKLPMVGATAAPLACALAAYSWQPWTGFAVLVDVDDHALTWTTLKAGQGHMQALDGKTFPRLNLPACKETLLHPIPDRSIHYAP